MRIRLCTVLLIGLLVSPALATVVVSFNPPTQPWGTGDVLVDIVANIAPDEAIIGWGLDLGISGNPALLVGPPTIGPLFTPAYAPDGDGLAGLVPPPDTVSGTGIVLATLQLHTDTPLAGVTFLDASYTLGDLTEGFMTENGFTPDVTFVQGTITPEPTSLLLLGLLALLRRR